jgi:DNA polymerase III delta' subunit
MKVLLSPKVERAIGAAKEVRSGSFIFVGPPHIGKATAAKEFARSLNCLTDNSGPCDNCKRLQAGAYPDFIVLTAEPGKGILIGQVRALRTALGLKPYESGRRIVLVDDAHLLTDEAQNALLKLIEEPPKDTIFILSTHRLMALLPTVRSRCAVIYFSPVEESEINNLLQSEYGVAPAVASDLAKASLGIPGRAVLSIPTDEKDESLKSLTEGGLLDRLVSVKRYLDDGADPHVLIDAIHSETTRALLGGEGQPTRLAALEKLATHLDAGVNARIALELFMVEL